MATTGSPLPSDEASPEDHRPFRRSWRKAPPLQLDFPPIRNGVDYLVSVVNSLHGDSEVGPREVKYAVLHLQAAAEVLLKARLLGPGLGKKGDGAADLVVVAHVLGGDGCPVARGGVPKHGHGILKHDGSRLALCPARLRGPNPP